MTKTQNLKAARILILKNFTQIQSFQRIKNQISSINSVQLINSDNTFDLIWIDLNMRSGNCGYNKFFRMINEEGWIFIDVWQRVDSEDNSEAQLHEKLNFKDSNLISNFNLIPKRLGHDFNLSWEKFIGLFQKNTKL